MYSSGQPKLSAYARTRFRVWVVVLSQGNKIARPAEILWLINVLFTFSGGLCTSDVVKIHARTEQCSNYLLSKV